MLVLDNRCLFIQNNVFEFKEYFLWGFCLNPEETLQGDLSLLIPSTTSLTLILLWATPTSPWKPCEVSLGEDGSTGLQ